MKTPKFKIGDIVILNFPSAKRFHRKEYYIHHFQGFNPDNYMYYLVPFGKSFDVYNTEDNFGANESDIELSEISKSPLFKALQEND